MCGIVGVLGDHEVAPILVEALKRLEYRGYDSAGIATIHDGHLDRRRAVGKLINLPDDHVIAMFVAIGKGTKEAWPRPGQLPLEEVVIEDRF